MASLALGLTACADDGNPPGGPLTAVDGWSAGQTDMASSFTFEAWSSDSFEATDMAFLPDGRALVTTKGGWGDLGTGSVILVGSDGTTDATLLELPVCTWAERGLLGIAVDPSFTENHLIYLFYTRQMNECVVTDKTELANLTAPVFNRVSAFVFDESGIDPASERVVVDELPGHQSSHNGGALRFMSDGSLVISVGEGTYERSRDVDFPAGKLLRVDPDGLNTGMPDNPWYDAARPSSVASMVYASGFRNPFRFDIEPTTGQIAVADVGTDAYEEIDLVEPGSDYGFPDGEGPESVDGAVEPALWYEHGTECSGVIGGAWVPQGWVPRSTAPGFAFSDFGCGRIFVASFEGSRVNRVTVVAPRFDYSVSSLVLGPDGALYAAVIGPGPLQIMRVTPKA